MESQTLLVRYLLSSTVKAGVDFKVMRLSEEKLDYQDGYKIFSISRSRPQEVWTVNISKSESFLDTVFMSSLETKKLVSAVNL